MILLGDTHSLKPVFEIIEKNNIKNSNIIHVGDFGLKRKNNKLNEIKKI